MEKKQIKTTKKQQNIKVGAKSKITKIAKAENPKIKFKPYASTNEMLAEVFSFYAKFNSLKGITEKEDYLKETKQRLALTAQKQKHHLLKILTENQWNDSEFVGLIFAIDLYITERRGIYLDTLLKLANMNILNVEEIINTYTERNTKLFSDSYLEELSFNRGALALSSKVIRVVNGGGKNISDKEMPKKAESVKALNPTLKSVKSICAELSKYVVGQEKAKKVLATALFEHILRIRLKEKGSKSKFDKKNVLMLGPTGSGKTYLCQILAKIAGIPFLMADSTQYSATGYVGGDVQDMIINLAQTTNTEEGKAIPLSIVFIDEFDKLKFSKDARGFDMTRRVQNNLLKMLESEKFYIHSKFSLSSKANYYDISKVLFVASGAFSDLEESSQEVKSIGFTSGDTASDNEVNVSKIAKYGFLPEILGRLTYRVCVDKLSKEQLTDILTKVEDSPIKQYSELYKECGKELVVPTDKISSIVDKALSEGTGARGLTSILGEYLREELSNMELPEEDLQQHN